MRAQSHSHQLKRHTTMDPILHTPSVQALGGLPSQPRSQIIQEILEMKPRTAQKNQPRVTSRTHKTQSAPEQKTAAQFFNSQNPNDRSGMRTQAKKRVYKFLHIDSRMEQQTTDRVKRSVKVVSLQRLASRRPGMGSLEKIQKGEEGEQQNEEQVKIVSPKRIKLPIETKKPKISINNLNPLTSLPPSQHSKKKQKQALESICTADKQAPQSTSVSYRVSRKKRQMSIPDFIKASLGIDRDSFIKVMPQKPMSPSRHQPTPLPSPLPATPEKQPQSVQESQEVADLMSTKIAFMEKEKRRQVKISQQNKPPLPRASKKQHRKLLEDELEMGQICGWDEAPGSAVAAWNQPES